MIKILHVLGALNRGGVETWLMHVLRHVDRGAFQLDFCCLSGEDGVYAPEARLLGSQVFPIRLTNNLPSFNQQFTRLLKQQRYCIVHSHVHQFSGYILRQAVKNNIPGRIAHSFTAPLGQRRSLARRFYLGLMTKWINQYMTVGLGNSIDSMVSLFGPHWQNKPRCKLLYCGIDLEPFSRPSAAKAREELGIPSAAPLIGHVGRLTPAKNHQFALDIAEAVQAMNPEPWFLFVGDGPLRQELQMIAQRRGLKQVVFSGAVHDIAPFLRSMNLFLFPSLWEGLPQSVIEAQAAGLRCLCSDVITTEVAVVPGAVQFMSLGRSATEWAQRSLSLLAAPRLSQSEAWETVASSPFAIQSSVHALVKVYEEEAHS